MSKDLESRTILKTSKFFSHDAMMVYGDKIKEEGWDPKNAWEYLLDKVKEDSRGAREYPSILDYIRVYEFEMRRLGL